MAPCTAFGDGRVSGHLPDGLEEVSGLAASSTRDGVLWAIEDSGNAASLHALALNGDDLGEVPVTGATNVDWEDVAVAGPDLFIADIGDNRARRAGVTVYRVPEPAGGVARVAATIRLRYPSGPADAEAIVVDPRSGDLFVLTKTTRGGGSHILRAPSADLAGGDVITMSDEGTVALHTDDIAVPGDDLVTGAATTTDGGTIFVRTYGRVLAYTRRAGDTVAEALRREPCVAPSIPESQGEAVAAVGRGYVTTSEGGGSPIHRFAASPLAPASPSTRPVWPVVALGVAVAAVAAVVLSRGRRRRSNRPLDRPPPTP